jgi:hypothetical protein
MLFAASCIIYATPASAVAIDNSISSFAIEKRQSSAPVFPQASIKIFRTATCNPLGGGPDFVEQRDNYSSGACSISPFYGPSQPFQKFYSIQAVADVPLNITCTIQTFAESVCAGTPNGQGRANECVIVPYGGIFYSWECSKIALISAGVISSV